MRWAAFAGRYEVECYRGSESDVLDRYYQAAKSRGAEIVVRITADCPLIDAEVIDEVVRAFLAEPCDYASNTLRATYPDGLDTEVFSFAALEKAWRQAQLATEREHVTPYLRKLRTFPHFPASSTVGGGGVERLRGPWMSRCDLPLSARFTSI